MLMLKSAAEILLTSERLGLCSNVLSYKTACRDNFNELVGQNLMFLVLVLAIIA